MGDRVENNITKYTNTGWEISRALERRGSIFSSYCYIIVGEERIEEERIRQVKVRVGDEGDRVENNITKYINTCWER